MPDVPPDRLKLADFLRSGEACHFAERTIRGGETVPLHRHDFIEVFWISHGGGTELRPQKPQPLQAGDLAFVSADHVHGFAAGAEGLTICNLAFPTRAWTQLRARYDDALPNRFCGKSSRASVPQLLGLLEDASDELRRGARTRLALDRFLLRIDAALASRNESTIPDWLSDATRRLNDDPQIDLTDGPAVLVKLCDRTPEHVARCCREHLDRTPTDIVDEARVRRAAKLLANTDRPVLQIGYDAGFNNVGHFHARFRHWFGQTPRHYRMRARATIRTERSSD